MPRFFRLCHGAFPLDIVIVVEGHCGRKVWKGMLRRPFFRSTRNGVVLIVMVWKGMLRRTFVRNTHDGLVYLVLLL